MSQYISSLRKIGNFRYYNILFLIYTIKYLKPILNNNYCWIYITFDLSNQFSNFKRIQNQHKTLDRTDIL